MAFHFGPWPDAGAGHRVRDLVQQHLVDLVVLVAGGEVLRDGDALVGVVAQPGAGLRVVEAEGPAGGRGAAQ